jgi:hypothetical protein
MHLPEKMKSKLGASGEDQHQPSGYVTAPGNSGVTILSQSGVVLE